MPSVFSHAVVAVALKAAFPAPAVPRGLLWLGVVCSVAPDLDVIGFGYGVPYESVLGHRGLSHSLAFAAVLSVGALFAMYPHPEPPVQRGWAWLYLFLAAVSHGLLDALTNGGLGVAFFAPFNNTRYFFPWDPIAVSPIGAAFFSAAGRRALANEFFRVWLPALVFALGAFAIRRLARGRTHAPAGAA
jgi:inner membrane protein